MIIVFTQPAPMITTVMPWDVAPPANQRRRPAVGRAQDAADLAGRTRVIPPQCGHDRALLLSRKGHEVRLEYSDGGLLDQRCLRRGVVAEGGQRGEDGDDSRDAG